MPSNVIQFTVRGKDDNSSKIFRSIAKGIAGIAAAIGGVVSAKEIGETIVSFEKLRQSVNTVSASAAAAEKNMGMIQRFAATTPFDLNQVTESFIKMKALGLDPSEEALRSYGNTAAAMGKSMNQMVEAVADASVGEFERLKEFGIRAQTELINGGDTVAFTFQGVTTSVANNSKAIAEYLQSIGETKFAGAMEDQANSVVGAVSNMGDTFTQLAVVLGDSGIRPLIRNAALAITRMMEVIMEHKDTIAQFIKSIVKAFLIVGHALVNTFNAVKDLFGQDFRTILTTVIDAFNKVGDILLKWAGTVVKNVGKIMWEGFPIVLKHVVQLFIDTFLNVAKMIVNIIGIALSAVIKSFAAFGEAINDQIQEIFFGGEASTFAESLKKRFSEAFDGALSAAKDTIKNDAAQIGEDVVDNVANAVEELTTRVGPTVIDSIGEVVSSTQEAGSALSDFFGLNMDLIDEQVETMTTGMTAFKDGVQETVEETTDIVMGFMDYFREGFKQFIDDQASFAAEFGKRLKDMAKDLSKSVGQAIGKTIVEGGNLMKAFKEIVKGVITNIIANLVELGVQRLILAALTKTAIKTETASEASSAVGMTFGNMMKTMAGAPFPINLTAPAVASAMAGVAQAGIASWAAVGKSVGGIAHGGLENVPKETTYLLDKGERVLSPNQNADLTKFLKEEKAKPAPASGIATLLKAVTRIASNIPKPQPIQVPQVGGGIASMVRSITEKADATNVTIRSQTETIVNTAKTISDSVKSEKETTESSTMQMIAKSIVANIPVDQPNGVLSLESLAAASPIAAEEGGFVSGFGSQKNFAIDNIQISILENVSDVDPFLELSNQELKELVADRIIGALDELDAEGTRPAFADRTVNT